MEKENKENFIELPLHAFKKKNYSIPSFLLESKLQRTAKNLVQLKKIIESQQYIYLSVISEERNIFCVKLTSNDKLAIVEIKEVSAKNRCIYVSLNLSLSLKKQIRKYFMMKNWKIQNRIYVQDERGSGLAILEYNFVEMDLRNFISKQQHFSQKLSEDILFAMSRDLIQNLCEYHLQQTTILDIRPQTILYQDGKWFILNGDFASKTTNQFGSTLNKPITVKLDDTRYAAPVILQNYVKNDNSLTHNPYKSDVYSLGLIIFQLVTLGVIDMQEFKSMLQNRNKIGEQLQKYDLSFRQKLVIIGQRFLKIPNLLEDMLEQKQQNRLYIFEVCLNMKFTTSLMAKILPPFQIFFKKEIFDQVTSSRRKIIYTQCSLQYDGEINLQLLEEKEEIVRHGRGNILNNGQKIYDGEWLNNVPNGKCQIQFSKLLSYEGHLKNGLLNGQGILTFNGSRISQSKWHEGLCEQRCNKLYTAQQLQAGYYLFKENKAGKVMQTYAYYHKLHKTNSKYIINLMNVSYSKIIMQILKKMLKTLHISSINLKGKTFNKIFCSNEFQLIKIQGKNIQTRQQQTIDILTQIGQSLSILIKLINDNKNNFEMIELDCSYNDTFQEQSFGKLLQIIPSLTSLNFTGCQQISDVTIKLMCNKQQNMKQLRVLILDKTVITDRTFNQLLSSSLFNSIQKLSLEECKKLTGQKLADFLSNDKTFNINELNIAGLQIDHLNFEKIIKNHDFKKIQSINLGMCHKISQSVMIQLLRLKSVQSLKQLSIYSTTFKDPILEVLSSKDIACTQIKNINLSGCINFTPIGLSKYFFSDNISSLQSLHLSGTELTDDLLIVMSKKSIISYKLRQLSLICCYYVTDKGIRQFLRPDKFLQLKKLDLSKNNLSNDTLLLLSQITRRQLQYINLSKCSKMNDLGFQKLFSSQNIRSLKQINISGTSIKQTSFNSLINSKNTLSLKKIDLSDCKCIEEQALIGYTSCSKISNLDHLSMNNTFITEKTIKSLQENPFLTYKLIYFSFDNCKYITDNMIERLSLSRKINKKIISQDDLIKNNPKELSKNILLSKMTDLSVNKKEIKDLHYIFGSDYIINLNKVSLNWIDLNLILQKISSNNNLQNLRNLNLTGSIFEEDKLQVLLKSTIIKNLQYLDLSWTQCTNKTLYAMSQSGFLNDLRSLKLAKCTRINDKGFQKYFLSSNISSLSILDIRSSLITNLSLQSLFSSKYLKNLSYLCLRSCPNIKDNAFKQYFKTGNCSILKQLDIGWTKVNGQIFNFMASSKKLNQLYTLRIPGLRGIQFELCKFIESSSSSSLTLVDANYAQLSSKFLNAISTSRYMSSLQEFQLKGFALSHNNIQTLSNMIKSSNASKLMSLKLSKSKNESVDKLFTQLNSYIGRIQQLWVIGLQNVDLQKWQKMLKKVNLHNTDETIEYV